MWKVLQGATLDCCAQPQFCVHTHSFRFLGFEWFVRRSVGWYIFFTVAVFLWGYYLLFFFCCSFWLFLGFPGRRLFPRVFPGWKREWQQRYVLAFRNKKRTRRKMILFFGNTRPIGEGRGENFIWKSAPTIVWIHLWKNVLLMGSGGYVEES